MEDLLVSIGLGARVTAFKAQGITRAELSDLTDENLRELGLTIGERKRLLRTVLAETGVAAPTVVTVAERRPLSMMFVDLVGSSRLAEQLAPEDLMELIRRYGDFCAGPIARYGGRIVRMVGDGILALFCYPIANENDPERAVRAALDVVRGVGKLDVPGGERLAVRIGIATGQVVVGDLHTAGGIHRQTVIGTPPNLAARLQALAPPDGIVVAEETYLRVRDRFVCADLGSFELRGLSQPRSAWQVLRQAAPHGRIARPREAPMIGRAQELAALRAAWTRALAGQGGLVVVSGEPGIGKSRLLETFLTRTRRSTTDRDSRIVTILLEGSAFESDSPLRPVSTWLGRLAESISDEDGIGRRTRLATALSDWPVHEEALAALLGHQAPRDRTRSPEQVREATLGALEQLILAQTDTGPLQLIAEDLHWFDPTTLELVRRLAGRVAGRRALMLLSTRSGFEIESALGLTDLLPSAAHLRLSRLPEADAVALAASMLPDQDLPAAWQRTIARKADGVPLFVQEVVRALAARGDAALPDDAAADTVIPGAVHELLAGRLDRLGEAKQIAQAAAVIGREFRREVLAQVCVAQFGLAAAGLEDGLQSLVSAGVMTEGTDGSRAGTFVHALLRDAAYESLLREPRQALHRRVAQALLTADPETATQQPELLARHLEAGADAAAAVPYWLQAGRRSLAANALIEATRLLERGLALLDEMPQTPDVSQQRLEFMTVLGPALMAVRGAGSPEAARLYTIANALCQELPESPRNFPIYWGWWRVSRDNLNRAERARTLLARERRRRDPELLLQAYHCSWASEFFVGNYQLCCEHAQAGLAIYDQHDFRHHAHIYGGHDAKVCGHGELALSHWMMGRPLAAQAQDRLAMEWAHRLHHVGSVLHNRENRLYRFSWTRDLDQVAAESDQMLRLAADQGMEDLRAKGLIFLGWATALRSDLLGGLRMLEDGWQRQCAIGTNEDFPVYVSLLAEALIRAGQPERALEALRKAETEFDETGLWFWRSEVRRMQAEALLAADPKRRQGHLSAEAARVFEEAIEIAGEQGASMLALRAASGLAHLDPGARSLDRVRRFLATVSEDDGGVDIRAAQALLNRERETTLDAAPAWLPP